MQDQRDATSGAARRLAANALEPPRSGFLRCLIVRLTSATVMNSFFCDASIRDTTSAKNRKANGRCGAAAGEFHAGEVRDALA